MDRRSKFISVTLSSLLLAAGMAIADDDGSEDAGYCMNVDIAPFHMMPDPDVCTVKDYWDGDLQEAFYPFTVQEHLFNCDYFGPFAPLPTGDMVPSSVVSEGEIEGTIGGHPFRASLYCASLTNWYQDSCTDPENPMSCTVQLAQPVLTASDDGSLYPRVTEVSVFDGVITVEKRKETVEIPIVLATRAAGMMHAESLEPPFQVGATITHSALGMVTYEDDGDDVKVLDGSLDLLLQGHIFHPDPVGVDMKAARIKGVICSEDLYKLLNRTGGKGKKGRKGKDHDDD